MQAIFLTARACLAEIVAALKHFRRPDVEVIGDEVTVVSCNMMILNTEYHQHLPSERAPVL
jgi:hypothetical protein